MRRRRTVSVLIKALFISRGLVCSICTAIHMKYEVGEVSRLSALPDILTNHVLYWLRPCPSPYNTICSSYRTVRSGIRSGPAGQGDR